MPKRLPEVESEILRLYLNGVPRDEIARRVGVAGGTVSNVVTRFKGLIKKTSLDGASKICGISSDIESLRNGTGVFTGF